MRRLVSGLQQTADVEPRTVEVTGNLPWTYRRLVEGRDGDPLRGASASMEVIDWPDGFERCLGTPGQLEWHPNHEEVFVLEGQLDFEGGATLTAPAYFNHPPFWLHPTAQHTKGTVRLLRHQSEFPAVGFEMPCTWDGRGAPASGLPSRCTGVDGLDLASLEWDDSHTDAGEPAGWGVKRIWVDNDDGWLTTLVRVPEGWRAGDGEEAHWDAEEWYMLEGGITLNRGGERMSLMAGGHFCLLDPAAAHSDDGSSGGCTALRWTRPAPVNDALWRTGPPAQASKPPGTRR